MEKGGTRYYYHFDGLGSVAQMTDDRGQITEKYEYDAYGNTIIKDASGSTLQASNLGNPYMFTGREYDPETGLYYYRARYYSPSLGRFLQRDPIGYYAGMNLYTYVNNNPTNLIDPLGLCGEKQDYWEEFRDWLEKNFGISETYAGDFSDVVLGTKDLYDYYQLGKMAEKSRELHYRKWTAYFLESVHEYHRYDKSLLRAYSEFAWRKGLIPFPDPVRSPIWEIKQFYLETKQWFESAPTDYLLILDETRRKELLDERSYHKYFQEKYIRYLQ